MQNSIYKKNIDALEKISKRSTDFIEYCLNHEDEVVDEETAEKAKTLTFVPKRMKEDIEIIVEKAYDGSKIFRVKKDGKDIYLNGKRNPGKIPDMWTEKFDKLPRTSPIIMFGIGDGSYLLEIHKKVKEDVDIFVYEPSLKIFLKCLEETDLSEVFKKRNIGFGIDNNISYVEIRDVFGSLARIDNMEFLRNYVLPGYARLYPEETKMFLDLFRRKIHSVLAGFNTQAYFSGIAMTTMMRNCRYLPDCSITFQLLKAIPRTMPAIVVAAGPSLNKNISELKNAKNKAFIIAVDTAIRPLVREGIIPDMYVVVDAGKPVELVRVPEMENVPLLASMIASQDVMDFHKGKKFFFGEGIDYVNNIFSKLHIKFPSMQMGGSVATTAFSLAYVLGLDNIILIGQDLALEGTKVHADGTFEKEIVNLDEERIHMVPGNIEKEVPTLTDYKFYIEWYEYFINGARDKRPNLRVINATEGGARIQGTEIMTLKEAIDTLCNEEVDIAKRIAEIPPIFDEDNREKVIGFLKETEVNLRKISENAKKQKVLYKKIDNMANTGRMQPVEYGKLLNRLKKLNKEILNKSEYQMIDDSLVGARMVLHKELLVDESSPAEEGKELARKGLLYMDLVSQCADLFAEFAHDIFSEL